MSTTNPDIATNIGRSEGSSIAQAIPPAIIITDIMIPKKKMDRSYRISMVRFPAAGVDEPC
jgi:hypothetical protein